MEPGQMTTNTKVKITAATREVILAALIIMRANIQQINDIKMMTHLNFAMTRSSGGLE